MSDGAADPQVAQQPAADTAEPTMLDQYQLPDGTIVQVMSDGTEYHYPPEGATYDPAAAGDAPGQTVMYDPETGNPLGNEFNPETQFYQQHYQQAPAAGSEARVAGGTPMANADTTAAAAAAPADAAKDDDGDADGKNDDDEGGHGISAPQTLHAESLQTSGFWIIDVLMEAYFSLAFKIWACQLFATTWIITLFYTLNLEFALLYRIVAPPTQEASGEWQSLGYISMFFAMSFFATTVINCQTCIIREIWQSTPRDRTVLGISISNTHPPYFVYVIIVLSLTVLPIIWSMILTLSTSRTAAYFFQFGLYISVIITFIFVCVAYCVLWVNSFRFKTIAYGDREEEVEAARAHKKKHGHHHRHSSDDDTGSESSDESDESEDDEDEGEGGKHKRRKRRGRGGKRSRRSKKKRAAITINQHGRRMNTISAFDSEHTLEEFGLHPRVVRWMVPVFVVGWLPALIVAIAFAFDEVFPTWSLVWIFVGVLLLIGFILLAEATSRLKTRHGTIVTIVFIVVWILVGILGTGLSGNAANIGIFLFLLIATHFLMLRKRPFELLPHEIEERFGPSVDVYGDGDPVDSYLIPCRNTVLAFGRCGDLCDVYGVFGKKDPRVRAYEKRVRHENLQLITDQRVLLWRWVLLWVLAAVGITFAADLTPFITTRMASDVAPAPLNTTTSFLCTLQWNNNHTANHTLDMANLTAAGDGLPAQLDLRDLSHLNLATYGPGDNARSALRVFLRRFPGLQYQEPSGGNSAAVGRHELDFIDFWDNYTNYHFITIRAVPRATGFMRAIDAYGEWLVVKVASAFSPFVAAWPISAKRDFIAGTAFLKQWMGGDILTEIERLSDYVNSKKAENPTEIIMIGGGFNGAFARAVAHRTGVKSVTFNSAGTDLMHKAFGMDDAGVIRSSEDHWIFNTDTDAYSQIGGFGADGTVVSVPCSTSRDDRSFTPECSQPAIISQYLLETCGDPIGARVNSDIVAIP